MGHEPDPPPQEICFAPTVERNEGLGAPDIPWGLRLTLIATVLYTRRVVLGLELNLSRSLLTRDMSNEGERKVDARRHTS